MAFIKLLNPDNPNDASWISDSQIVSLSVLPNGYIAVRTVSQELHKTTYESVKHLLEPISEVQVLTESKTK